jgi:hypothetical protein
MSTTNYLRVSYRKYALVAVVLLTTTISGRAQDERRLTLNAGAGFSPLVGQISDRLNNGWNITVGGGYRFTRHFETNLQFTYNGFGVRQVVLTEAAVPGANSHMWSITVDPKLRLRPSRSLSENLSCDAGSLARISPKSSTRCSAGPIMGGPLR